MNARGATRKKHGRFWNSVAAVLLAAATVSLTAGAGEAPPPTDGGAGNNAEQALRTRAKKLLQREAAESEQKRQRIQVIARRHLEAGKRLFSVFAYRQAKDELEQALRLDRSNDEARRLLIQVKDVLGERKSRYLAAVSMLSEAKKVRIQQQLVELDARLDYGRRLMKEAKAPKLTHSEQVRFYERALEAFERAREIIHWMDPGIDVDRQRRLARRLKEEARRAIKAVAVDLAKKNLAEAQRLAQEQRASEEEYIRRRVNQLVDRAKALFERGEYAEAERLAGKILQEDPANTDAQTIEAMARDRKHTARKAWIKEELAYQHEWSRLRAERMGVPYGDYLIYPEDWAEITRRRTAQVSGAAAPREERWKQQIKSRLARKVTVDFTDRRLDDVLKLLSDLGNVPIIMSQKAVTEGARETPVRLKVKDMPLSVALKWILKTAALAYDIRDQAVYVAKPTDLEADVVMHVYDIRDLTTTLTPFPGPRIDLGTDQNAAAGMLAAAPPPAPAVFAETDVQSLIQNKLLRKDFENPKTSIALDNGRLVVMQTPEVHEKIRRILQSLRENQAIQVLTNVRFIDVREGFLESIGVHFSGLDEPVGYMGVPHAYIDPLNTPPGSASGISPNGGWRGLTSLPSDIANSAAYQFQNSLAQGGPFSGTMAPPFHFDQGPPSSNGRFAPLRLHPRIDANFPIYGQRTYGAANAPAGLRRQWYEKWFGSPVLTQAVIHNYTRLNPLSTILGQSFHNFPEQGAIFQFRFLQSTQANVVLQAVRKDRTSDVLLSPRMVQFNNQRAHVLFAQQRAYISDYDVSGAVFDPVIRSFMVGVVLDVQPTVSSDKRYITLTLRPGTAEEIEEPQIIYITDGGDVDNPFGTINLPIELPQLELRSISTSVTTPDGGTLLFSGLISDRKMDAKSGVPFLSDLPVIGRLFSENHKERARRNLLVLVNAKLILFDEEEQKL